MKFPRKRDFVSCKSNYLRRGISNIADIINSVKSVSEFRAKLSVISVIDIQKIEFRTRGQASNPSWFYYRKGVITGTILKSVLRAVEKGEGSEKLNKSIEKRFSYRLYYPSVVWGVQNESRGLHSFWLKFKKEHSDTFLSTVGFKIDEELKVFGGSADGICHCSCHGRSVIEIKCSFKLREQSPGENRWDELPYISDNSLKTNHGYYYQIMGYMHLYNIDRTYFVVWTPAESLILEVFFDMNLWQVIENAINIYYYSYYLERLM